MKYRAFARSGQRVSALGYGCMRLPQKDGGIDRARAIALLRRAIDGGVSYVDTAYYYHDGHSEELVGEALEGRLSPSAWRWHEAAGVEDRDIRADAKHV